MGRRPCCAKVGMNKGSWSAPEDEILIDYIKVHGEGKWRDLPRRAGLKRCGKSCRLRWLNYLRSDIIRGNITDEEEELIVKLHKLLGNRWSLIAGRLPGRTDNEVKNYWNTNLSKRDQPKPSQNPKQDRQKQENTQDLKKPSIVANVEPIRPRAVRCTKVVISQITEVQTKSTNEFVPHHQQWDSIIASDEKGLQNENSRDCLLDFDIDDFLLDPLNGDLYVNSEVEGEDYSLKEMPFYPDFPGLDELGDDQLKEIEDLDFRNLETFLNSEEAQENTQDLKKPSIVATVEPIRPRARRCTKVVIPQITEIQTKSTNEFVPHHQQWDSIIVSDEKVLQNENSMDCLLDFEINDFMLDALNGDLYVNLEVEGEDYSLKEMPFYPDFPGFMI